jgi:hypothetical protein
MSIGSLGIVGGLAASNLAQRTADTEKVERETLDQARVSAADRRAESAAGIGQTEEDTQSGERDADGRRLWEEPPRPGQPAEAAGGEPSTTASAAVPSKDPSGAKGGRLDLWG